MCKRNKCEFFFSVQLCFVQILINLVFKFEYYELSVVKIDK